MADSAELRTLGNLDSLMRGASNAVTTSLAITDKDVVTIICDEASMTVAASILRAVDEIGAKCHAFIFERRLVRPATALPPEVLRALQGSTASFYTVNPVEGEFPHRRQLIDQVGPYKLRHAHMINITEDSMKQGMLTDYLRVERLNEIVCKRLKDAKEIHVTGKHGTDVKVKLDLTEEMHSEAGVIKPGEWANLPSGEVFMCPLSVDGVYYCDGIVPSETDVDRFDLGRKPLRIEMQDARLVSIEGGPGDLANSVLAAIRSGNNMDRIGMFAVGTNFDLLMPIGDKIQDQFIPGCYFSFGRPYAVDATAWTSSAQYLFSARKTSLAIDGLPVIEGGRFARSILDLTKKTVTS